MIRKLIMLAITSGLAKKAWDSYQQGNRGSASAGHAARGRASTVKPKAKAKIITPDNRPDAF
jgi:hypothetical protein